MLYLYYTLHMAVLLVLLYVYVLYYDMILHLTASRVEEVCSLYIKIHWDPCSAESKTLGWVIREHLRYSPAEVKKMALLIALAFFVVWLM